MAKAAVREFVSEVLVLCIRLAICRNKLELLCVGYLCMCVFLSVLRTSEAIEWCQPPFLV